MCVSRLTTFHPGSAFLCSGVGVPSILWLQFVPFFGLTPAVSLIRCYEHQTGRNKGLTPDQRSDVGTRHGSPPFPNNCREYSDSELIFAKTSQIVDYPNPNPGYKTGSTHLNLNKSSSLRGGGEGPQYLNTRRAGQICSSSSCQA
jgi:hypothetical protein